MDFQIVIDSNDPHRIVRFWAQALGMEIEDHHDQVVAMLEAGQAEEEDTVTIDGRRAWKEGAALRDPEGRRPRILFQLVPEPKTTKNRVHLDVRVGDEHREARVEELIAAGAERLWDGQQGPFRWVTMADPEGNEFCVT
ncbi:MAG: VOC family protein [Actinomycetes bacterium]|jgi:catechol 2,3-dioxygenase-like lactoylglutathione lyase family enzyme|nr:VOC family protein [Acidimicrobiia bacterium]